MFDTRFAWGSPFGIADAEPDVSAMPPRAAIPKSASLSFMGLSSSVNPKTASKVNSCARTGDDRQINPDERALSWQSDESADADSLCNDRPQFFQMQIPSIFDRAESELAKRNFAFA